MRLEIHTIAGEETPTVIAECLECGSIIAVRERDFLFSRPLHCNLCHHERTLSYREFILICDAIAPQLLAHSVSRLGKNRRSPRSGRH